MKTVASKKEFTPVSITITFESQKELDDFGTLCNYAPLNSIMIMPDYEEFAKLGADIHHTEKLTQKLKKWFQIRD